MCEELKSQRFVSCAVWMDVLGTGQKTDREAYTMAGHCSRRRWRSQRCVAELAVYHRAYAHLGVAVGAHLVWIVCWNDLAASPLSVGRGGGMVCLYGGTRKAVSINQIARMQGISETFGGSYWQP